MWVTLDLTRLVGGVCEAGGGWMLRGWRVRLWGREGERRSDGRIEIG